MFVCGFTERELRQNATRYIPESDKWERMATPTIVPADSPACCKIPGTNLLLVHGGWDRRHYLGTMFVYNPGAPSLVNPLEIASKCAMVVLSLTRGKQIAITTLQ